MAKNINNEEPGVGRDSQLSPSERVTAIFQAIDEMQEAAIEPPSISPGSQAFLDNIKAKNLKSLSPKQEKWLADIEADILQAKGDSEDEPEDVPHWPK